MWNEPSLSHRAEHGRIRHVEPGHEKSGALCCHGAGLRRRRTDSGSCSRAPQKKAALKSLGVWAFHGAKDTTVVVEESQRMTNALMRAGCKDVKLTVYPDAGHDSWKQAYNEPELWDWFLSHRREK